MNDKIYVVYMLANKKNGTIYIGVTSDLKRRMIEHRSGLVEGFAQEYDVKKLVYFEQYKYIDKAVTREKQLKNWKREWKIVLIEKQNPDWNDLCEEIFGPEKK
jgi:putative endonuclease